MNHNNRNNPDLNREIIMMKLSGVSHRYSSLGLIAVSKTLKKFANKSIYYSLNCLQLAWRFCGG